MCGVTRSDRNGKNVQTSSGANGGIAEKIKN